MRYSTWSYGEACQVSKILRQLSGRAVRLTRTDLICTGAPFAPMTVTLPLRPIFGGTPSRASGAGVDVGDDTMLVFPAAKGS